MSPMESVSATSPNLIPNNVQQMKKTPAEAQETFKQALNESLKEVNESQKNSDEMTKKLVTGEVEDLHEVMVAAEKASINLQTTVEVRNKMIEAYKEVMRMQV